MRFDNGADKLIMASANTSHFEIRLEIWKFLMMFAGSRHIDMLELGHSSALLGVACKVRARFINI